MKLAVSACTENAQIGVIVPISASATISPSPEAVNTNDGVPLIVEVAENVISSSSVVPKLEISIVPVASNTGPSKAIVPAVFNFNAPLRVVEVVAMYD